MNRQIYQGTGPTTLKIRLVHSAHPTTVLALLKTFSWQELRHHPWQNAAAVVAVMLGVALAFAVHVINASALDEFAQGLRAVNGQSDVEFRGASGSLHGDLS